MASVVIVTGCPGSGKTTVCRALASGDPQGLHLASDTFLEFIAHLKDPTTPESHQQNTVVMHALASSVEAFSKGGYAVYFDGIVGPWFLPLLRPYFEPLGSTHYVVLQVPEQEALARVRGRQGRGMSPKVTHMHGQLADLGSLAKHGIDVGGMNEAESLATLTRRLSSGSLELDWSLLTP